jgi:ABC-type amino acid transport substrate-binding protein
MALPFRPIAGRLLRRRQLLALPALLLAGAARASEEALVVGVEDVDYDPIMNGSDGRFSGYAFQLLELFARRQGLRFSYRPLPIKRMTPFLLDGQIDLCFPDNPNWRLDLKQGHELAYSEAFVPFQDMVFVKTEAVGRPIKRLGVVRGFTPKRFQAQIDSGEIQLTEATAPANLVKMALAGRIDGVALAGAVGRHQLRLLGQPAGLEPDPAYHAKFEMPYRLSSLRHPEVIAQFNDFLKAEATAIQALQKRFGL